MQRKLPSARIVAAAAVLILHFFVIALFVRGDRPSRTDRSEEEHAGILYLLSPSQPARQSPERARAARDRHPRRTRLPDDLRMPVLAAPRQLPGLISVPSGPKVDWYHEAEVVAHTITGTQGTGVHPGSGEHEHSPYRKCAPRPGFAWDPEPKRVGFMGLMPYLRIGKRCFIALGAFGCAIGPLPEPNGHLLDAIKDGPVTFTSVPDDDDCDK